MSEGHKALTLPGPPQPPMIPNDPVQPMDFNPHVEWYEFPKELFDMKFPYTREECIRMQDERWDSTADEMADKYGMKVSPPPKVPFAFAYFTACLYIWFELWSTYRGSGNHPTWPMHREAVRNSPTCPTITEDEVYLDQWRNPVLRQREGKFDAFWNWKPVVKKEPVNPHAIPYEIPAVSTWQHMTMKN
jgi:hypothetical protein